MPQETNSSNTEQVETLDFLNSADETTEAKAPEKIETKTAEGTEAEDTEDTTEETPELELGDEPEEELTYDATPSVSQLKKDAPDLFKKYPTLEKALRREARYSEVFPTVQEAADAASAVTEYRQVESEINSGSIAGLLSNIQQSNPKAFAAIADNLLDTIRGLDQNAFLAVSSQNVSNLLSNAFNKFKAADKESDQYQIALAAQILYNYISGGSGKVGEVEQKTQPKDNPEAKRLADERAAFEQDKFNNHASQVNGGVKRLVEQSIEKALDPRGVMSNYVRSRATEDCVKELVDNIQTDTRFNKILTQLWEASRTAGYSDSSKAKIRQALLNKAKAVLPDIIHRVKTEATKGVSSQRNKDVESEAPVKRGRPTNSTTTSSKSNSNGKGEIPRGMSSRDFLMQD